MAAYDLPVQRVGNVQVPNLMGQSANSLTGFLRQAQERKNQEDKVALAQSMFEWDKGQQDREEKAAARLNSAMSAAKSGAQQHFSDNFQFNKDNVALVENDARFKALNLDEQGRTDWWENARSQFADPSLVAKHVDPARYEQMLREKYAGTHASREQIDDAIKSEMSRVYPQANPQLTASLMSSLAGGNSRLPKDKYIDYSDSKTTASDSAVLEDYLKSVDAENTSRWFPAVTDWGNTDITKPAVNKFASAVSAKLGYNNAEIVSGLRAITDGDTTLGNLETMLSADPNGDSDDSKALRMFTQGAQAARNLKNAGKSGNQQSANGNGAALLQMMQQSVPKGSTVKQRGQMLLGMLPAIQQAAQSGDEDSQKVIEEVSEGKTPSVATINKAQKSATEVLETKPQIIPSERNKPVPSADTNSLLGFLAASVASEGQTSEGQAPEWVQTFNKDVKENGLIDTLMSKLEEASAPGSLEERAAELTNRIRVLENLKGYKGRLGYSDRRKLGAYLEELKTLNSQQ